MRVAIREIELCGPLELPPNLQEFDGVRVYCKIQGAIKGFATIWNSYKAIDQLPPQFRYPADFGSWLLLSQAFFSSQGAGVDNGTIKALLCAQAGINPESLSDSYNPPPPPEVPPLSASIVIPTYDAPDSVRLVLQHATRLKTQIPHEIIVVDNHPVSGLIKPIVEEFPGVRYVAEPRQGEAYARNAGLMAVRGDILVTLDSDVVVAEDWLDYLIEPFSDSQVGSVMSLVLPYEIEGISQFYAEEMRARRFGFDSQRLGTAFFNQPIFPAVERCGNTSAAAFRLSLFAEFRIGLFEPALGAGMPSGGGADTYLFYHVLAAGKVSVFEPRARAYHKHRSTMARLGKQLIAHESGYTAMLTLAASRDKDTRVNRKMIEGMARFQWRRIKRNLAGQEPGPLYLSLLRIWGNLSGPLKLWQSQQRVTAQGAYTSADFAAYLAQREPLSEPASLSSFDEAASKTKPYLCPLCGNELEKFVPGGRNIPVITELQIVAMGVRPHRNCPICYSTDKERLLYLYLRDKVQLFEVKKLRLLHFAPEPNLQQILMNQGGIYYFSADLRSSLAEYKMDITAITFKDNFFDFIICSHVLEHVIDDRKAMSELLRVLKPGGTALLQVPISLVLDKTYEDFSLISPSDRERVFGQDDHVRIYARDYQERLEEVGFKVQVYRFCQENGPELTHKYGLISQENVYACTKP